MIEIINKPPVIKFTAALFDFDGTVSLLREGWQEVMTGYFTEVLKQTGPDADENEIRQTVTEFVDLLTGKQTIYQCIALGEEVQKRGGKPEDPYVYKAEYLRRLMERIKSRHADLRNKKAGPETFLVPGAAAFLSFLRETGMNVYLASGTDEADVLSEVELLDVARYFNGGIYGALDNVQGDAKEMVIRRILSENKISGERLVAFGDGFVEIQLTKEAGGYAVAVATDETNRSGVNEWKRKRLLSAGADAVTGDFTEMEGLKRLLLH